MASRHVDDFDDDGFDDDYDAGGYGEGGEEELSPEDQAQMAEGTAAVRKALGPAASKVTLAQIQDSLWHYYYDIDKTVAYLTKTYIAPASAPKPTPKPAAKKVPEGMSNMFSCFEPHHFMPGETWARRQRSAVPGKAFIYADDHADNETAFTAYDFLSTPPPRRSLSAFFSDMPWLHVPEHRKTVFIAPEHPRGGLLGGGEGDPPMTKLQKLAAARKKKSEEKKESSKPKTVHEGMRKLSISEKGDKESADQSPPSAKRQKTTTKPDDAQNLPSQPSTAPQEPESLPDAPAAAASSEKISIAVPSPDNQSPVVSMAAPSAFARTLIGPALASRVNRTPEFYPIPYTSSPLFSRANFDAPSPDDIVLAAQAKAGKKSTPSSSKPTKSKEDTGKASNEEEATAGVSNLKINDAPPPKSKGLDVIKEFENSPSKRSVSFVVVGHVDAGKSTLMGRLLLELEHVEQRTVDKYRRQAEKTGKQSFAFAWVMDQRSEERERGVTIDIATNYFETDKTKFTILDAPGHKDFVPNMIAGASQADFAILVIDANTGAYEKGLKGQTREHVLLLRSIGVQRVVVAVNKLDMVGYSKDRFDEITQEVTGFLHGLGFQDKNVSFVPISGLNGDNIVRPIEDEAASWYKGETLVDALEASGPSVARALRKPLRMAISEVFRSQQGTATISGRVDSGTMQVGDVLVVQPSGETAYIKSIIVDKENKDWAVAGQNVSIALTNIDPIHIRVGDILCHPSDPIACGDSFTMKAMAFDHLLPSPVDLHRGRLHVPGRIQTIVASLDKATGQVIKKKPKVVQPGGVARVIIKLESRVPLEAGQRVVIRSGGETVAAGLME